MIITKLKYTEDTLNWVSVEFEDGTKGQSSLTDGIRRQYTDDVQAYLDDGGIVEPQYTLPDLRAQKKAELQAGYNTAIHKDISYMGNMFQAGEGSQSTLSKVLATGSVPAGFFWMSSENVTVAMDYVELQGLASALLLRGQLCFIELQRLKGQLSMTTTEKAISKIVWKDN